ncbi:hypothetical protein [Nitrospina gracilis]|uniref:hypothetical protein n=1 Tax=Nitrospina gracilis TaxID=35801 RepID=UPI001F27DBC3|nr:hypothetical protein [Nitrospina gracilis]MCF8721422.1 hypothetical protein [Nitrospina gracilis Nb-211]
MNSKKQFDNFWATIQTRIHQHPVIVYNPYCKWFRQGTFTLEDLIHLFTQFAVFSKWFLLVQMMRMMHAPDLEAEAHARYILANELGVHINPDGTTENQPFKTRWAHINWLRDTAQPLGLNPELLGSWNTATPSTRRFIRGLEETYGSKDGEVGRGASYAIETWAAWGIGQGAEESNNFWKELIDGLEIYNETCNAYGDPAIPLDFFEFHFNSEKGHGDNVLEELKQAFYKPGFDSEKFLQAGEKALDAIYTFWMGLDRDRHNREAMRNYYPLVVGA